MTPASHRAPFALVRIALGAGALLATAGCITPDGYYRDLGAGGSGQGGTSAGTGGATGSGGAGGTGAGGTGPVTGTGGATGAGGATGKGGATGAGGATGSGGLTGTGGATSTGGATGTGGAAGSGSGAVLFSDDFENGTTNWVASGPGTASTPTDGSTVYELSCLMNDVYLSGAGVTTWTDVIVQAKVKILSFNGSSSSYYAGICARVEDATDFYCVALRSDGNVAIRGDIGGSSNSIGSSFSYGVTTGTWYTVQLEVVGGTITASINGTPVLPKSGSSPITDSSLTHGGIALAVVNADAEFDDVSVTVP